MAGNGKHVNPYDYLTVIQTCQKGVVELDKPISKGRAHDSDIVTLLDLMSCEEPSQEDSVMKRDGFSKLSKESKEIIDIVLNSPSEIIECFTTPKYNKISRDKIKDYLVKQGWNEKLVKGCFKELKDFCTAFY